MLDALRSARWQRRGGTSRLVGLALLLVAFLAPLPGWAIAAALVPGSILFLAGAALWLVRDAEPWRRRPPNGPRYRHPRYRR